MVLRLRLEAPGAWERAKCRIINVTNTYDPFFDEPDESITFCNGDADGVVCPVREECLLFALTNNLAWGVYGGMGEDDRRALRKRWPLRRGKQPRPEWAWMAPGEAAAMLTPEELATLDEAWQDDE